MEHMTNEWLENRIDELLDEGKSPGMTAALVDAEWSGQHYQFTSDACRKKLSGADPIGYYAAGRCVLDSGHQGPHRDQWGDSQRLTMAQEVLVMFGSVAGFFGLLVMLVELL